ncbi:MAG TPA: hypothetical protein VL945_01425 [Candidatus Saccharimonadales bacterium]|nr:hypothetical protein [Candidatus Saccharimonadales bacterium]
MDGSPVRIRTLGKDHGMKALLWALHRESTVKPVNLPTQTAMAWMFDSFTRAKSTFASLSSYPREAQPRYDGKKTVIHYQFSSVRFSFPFAYSGNTFDMFLINQRDSERHSGLYSRICSTTLGFRYLGPISITTPLMGTYGAVVFPEGSVSPLDTKPDMIIYTSDDRPGAPARMAPTENIHRLDPEVREPMTLVVNWATMEVNQIAAYLRRQESLH